MKMEIVVHVCDAHDHKEDTPWVYCEIDSLRARIKGLEAELESEREDNDTLQQMYDKRESEVATLREALRKISVLSYGETGGMEGWINAVLVITGRALAKTDPE